MPASFSYSVRIGAPGAAKNPPARAAGGRRGRGGRKRDGTTIYALGAGGAAGAGVENPSPGPVRRVQWPRRTAPHPHRKAAMLEALKEEACWANRQLPAKGLVAWTSGNVCARDPASGLVVVKPSGVLFEEMTPAMMPVVDLEGTVVEGELRPSVDTATALVILREMPELRAVIHTHSGYASSFAALGRAIPVVLTEHGDAFGIPIPCGGYAKIGGPEIGEEAVRIWRDNGLQCPAVLMRNHGVFTVGTSVRGALKTAVVVEDIARTVHLAMGKGEPIPIPPEEAQRLYDVYHTNYGQRPGGGFD